MLGEDGQAMTILDGEKYVAYWPIKNREASFRKLSCLTSLPLHAPYLVHPASRTGRTVDGGINWKGMSQEEHPLLEYTTGPRPAPLRVQNWAESEGVSTLLLLGHSLITGSHTGDIKRQRMSSYRDCLFMSLP